MMRKMLLLLVLNPLTAFAHPGHGVLNDGAYSTMLLAAGLIIFVLVLAGVIASLSKSRSSNGRSR